MELVYLVQVLTAVVILCIFTIVMLSVMLCSTYCCNKPVWEQLKDMDVEMPAPEGDQETLF